MGFINKRFVLILLSMGSVISIQPLHGFSLFSERKEDCIHTIPVGHLPERINNEDDYDCVRLMIAIHFPHCRELLQAKLDKAKENFKATFAELISAHKNLLCACAKGTKECEEANQRYHKIADRLAQQRKHLCCIAKGHDPIDKGEARAIAMTQAYEAQQNIQPSDAAGDVESVAGETGEVAEEGFEELEGKEN